ncbi:alanine--tRNA ligase [Parachitinimonas caeni]|uniref:Alanine--tRNA ligase n=1 Tax=Parachitinimonas caeni TaxID=3031301 RepID=A0ABT7E3D5_9NEIS|nr:alanine--tRNA ligase [Parachitinimonas caeni]MDK2126831.1 alanine--tRNA ligase [Parachitinimonas caeni]
MKSAEIRQKFLDFFASKGHSVVASSSLIPGSDPTIMFTVAGMVQFKDVFLGNEKRAYTRAVTSQKCLRAGGKHNDLENVGYTARHHTFFEMLGNFSFGDYFKRDAISYAWEFLTSPQWLGLPKDKLMVTVYASDDEAFDIWNKEVGVPADKIVRIGDNKGAPYASDNFWAMGDTGPCGPCTEIFYDHGPEIPGGPPGSPDEDGDRYIEIWNNVFMQFNRDESGTMHPLPKPSVDTGMGLERLSAVLQHVHTNYETDTFVALLKAAARETGVPYNQETPSLKVIADHIRACAFLVADDVLPSNEGRGYVLRRIIRRAVRHGYKLGQKGMFFHKLVPDLAAVMGDAYPELVAKQDRIIAALKHEEEQFARTLETGMNLLDKALEGGKQQLDGKTAFTLHSTYGFPIDLTADICRERNIALDEAGYQRELADEQERGRKDRGNTQLANVEYEGADTCFEGYVEVSVDAKVLALYKEGEAVSSLKAGEAGVVVLDNTAFYAEGGGQVGDTGQIAANGGLNALFDVTDTQKLKAAVFGHHGKLARGSLNVGDAVTATIDLHRRQATARNHSATHLLHAALREVLGKHVVQKGSLVNSERTRFDFAHPQAVTAEEMARIEQIVNHVIAQNYAISATLMSYDDAIRAGAMALFGEKYGDEVRVLKMGEFSTELCGGTHVHRTGDIGFFKIVGEGGVASGIRRVEAVTGEGALQHIQAQEREYRAALGLLKAQPGEVAHRIEQLQADARTLEKELAKLKSKLAGSQVDALVSSAVEVDGIKVLAAELPDADADTLKDSVSKLKDQLGNALVVLASRSADKASICAGVSASLVGRFKAGELVNHVASQVGGKGGGRPDMAMAGGTQPENLPQALASVVAYAKSK